MASSPFDPLLFNLRAQHVGVGLNEWMAFLDAMKRGLARSLDDLYALGRALLIHTEAHYDAWDLAFAATFAGVALKPELKLALEEWLRNPKAFEEGRPPGDHPFESFEEMMKAFQETLAEQRERHEGGDRWVGTGGTSPWGTGGQSNQGIQLGEGGGNRGGIRLAESRQWRNYREDMTLGVRDLKIALRALRDLAREGPEELSIDSTIDATAKNAGEIELIFERERRNRVKVALLMDAGGSMEPHARLVSRLFTAAKETKTFKTFDHYYFHNCIYRWLYSDYSTFERVETGEVLEGLSESHRLIFVGDASMAPYELFSNASGYGDPSPAGIEWLRRFKQRCPAAVWLNPDPRRFWEHPTVSAIGGIFRMYPLTLEGLRESVQYLRAPR